MAGGRPLGRPEAGGFTVVKYLATRRAICPAIRTVEGPSRPHIIKDQGHRHVAGGRKDVRASLYMAALSALRSNPAIRDFAAKLKARGKPSKVILTAIMRKLIVIMNAVLKEGQVSNRYGAA